MSRLAFGVFTLSLASCVTSSGSTTDPSDPDLILASGDAAAEPAGAWDVAPTLHANERAGGVAPAHGRRVFPIWVAGSAAAPVSLDVVALANDGDDVRVAILGPMVGGQREVLAAAGYAQPRGNVEMSLDVATSGEHLIVVGAFELARPSAFRLDTYCISCEPETSDILASPKTGALSGTGDRIVHATLGNVLANRTTDVELELWAGPPARPGDARMVATSVASGNQVNVIVPASVAAGDDLRLVVRDARGTVLDTGVAARFAPDASALVRTDALVYGIGGELGATGVVGMFEGRAHLALRSESRHAIIAETTIINERPGQAGNGWAAFDALFVPATPADAASTGEPVSINVLGGDGEYHRLACFAYRGARTACP